jgi:hypothetical protein
MLKYLDSIQSYTAKALRHLNKLNVANWPIPPSPTPRNPLVVLTNTSVHADLVVAQQMSITATMHTMITSPYYPKGKDDSGLFVNPILLHNELQKLCEWFSRHHAVPDKRVDREVKILKFLQTWYVDDFLPPLVLLTEVLEGAVEDRRYWKLPADTETVERRLKYEPGDGVELVFKRSGAKKPKPKPKTLAEYAAGIEHVKDDLWELDSFSRFEKMERLGRDRSMSWEGLE